MKVSRRIFLKSGGVAMIGMSTIPAFLQRAVAATPMPNKKKLIVVFQRGAADGLNIVVPFGEENYYRIRPTIAIPQPRNGTALLADLFITIGSSLVVYPAAGFPELAKRNGSALVILNLQRTGLDEIADLVLNRSIGDTLGAVVGVD